jgi:PAS domain S-box-containing protein
VRIVYVNPAFEDTSGYSKKEVIGRTPDFLFRKPPGIINPVLELKSIIDKNGYWHGTLESLRIDGSSFRKDTMVSAVKDDKGQYTGYVSIGRDVTKELELEQQLIQSQKLEAVGRLAGGVAHDFNNLLNVIVGNAEICRVNLDNDDPLHDQIRGILRTADSATLLTRQLLALSRQHEPKVEDVDLNQIITDMQNILQPLVGNKIELKFELAADLDNIEADRSHVEQIVLNLVVNARDALVRDGVIVIRTERIKASASDYSGEHPEAVRVLLTISDNGPGIPAEITDRIFEPFYTTKEDNKGTGLGLSTVQGIVKKHGGTIMVESQPGHGAEFKIVFPVTGAGNIKA